MVEKGLMEVDDPALAERLRNLKTKRAELQCQIDGGSANNPAQRNILTEAKVVRTAEAVRGALQDASPERRKAYLKLFVDKVVISKEEIRISGPKCALALAATRGLPDTTDGVITFVRGWRPVGDGTSFAHKILIWNEFQTPHLVHHTRGDTFVCHKSRSLVKMGLASRSRLPVHLPARTIT